MLSRQITYIHQQYAQEQNMNNIKGILSLMCQVTTKMHSVNAT